MNDYQNKLRRSLIAIPITPPPSAWRLIQSHGIGGLTEVGYAPDSDLLLVVSHQGRGVFDCATGERIARDQDENWEGLDQRKLISPGIGPLENQIIRIAGLHGGGMSLYTSDNWALDVMSLEWPIHCLFLSHRTMTADGVKTEKYKLDNDEPCEYRAVGFSETEQSFIFATSCELTIYSRIAG